MNRETRLNASQRIQRRTYIDLDGVDEYLFTPTSQTPLNITGNITISAWIKTDVGSTAQTIVAKQSVGYTTSCTYELSLTNGVNPQLQFIQYAGGVLRTTTSLSAIPIGQWCHVAVTRSGTTTTVYFNGTADNTSVYAGTSTSLTTELKIGRREGGANHFNGAISEIRIYNRALDISEIQAYKNRSILNDSGQKVITAPITTNLQYYLPIDEGTGATGALIRDYSNNAIQTNLGFTEEADWKFVNLPPIYREEYKGHTSFFLSGSIQKNINSGVGGMSFSLPASNPIFKNNEAIILDLDYSILGSNSTIFKGVSKIREYRGRDVKQIDVEAYSIVSELSNFTPRSYAGDYNIVFSATTIENCFRYLINSYNLQNPILPLSYTSTSIASTGLTIAHTFYNSENYIKAFNDLWQYAPSGWYWFIDQTNTFYFKQSSATDDYIFIYGKDYIDGKIKSDSTQIENRIRITNGAGIHRAYQTENSITRFGQYQRVIKDEKINNSATMDYVASKLLATNSTPNEEITATIIDITAGGQYNIMNIQPGSTFSVVNTDETTIQKVISSIKLYPNQGYAEIIASDKLEYVSRELNKLKSDQFSTDFDNTSPNAYTEVI